MLADGSILDGRYEILGRLAEGGMGAVYRARRVLLGDLVAVKVIRPAGDDPGLRQRFMRESRISAELRHPHVVAILDFNVDPDGRPYLVMEYLNGRSLRQEVAEGGPLDLAKVQAIVPPLCTALQMAHDRGILHRDLKTANIVSHRFDSGQTIYKIIDFGLANMQQSGETTRLTAAHQFVGTMSYAAPEQLTGGQAEPRSDLYSFGIVLFELLTGEVPFKGPDVTAVVAGHLTAPPPSMRSIRPELPGWVDAVVATALAKRPDERWPSMMALAQALSGPAETPAASLSAPAVRVAGLEDRYELGGQIAQGRFGSEVYAGRHRVLGYPVAIRILRRASRPDWEAVRGRFLHEARTMQVSHPSILQVRDFGEDPTMVYVVTDLVEGVSLRERLDLDGPIGWPRLGPLVAELVDAAAALHRKGGLVGVLTPAVVRLTRDEGEGEAERALVSSAGIQQVRDLLATLDEQTLRGGRIAGGELRYVAPEVLTGGASRRAVGPLHDRRGRLRDGDRRRALRRADAAGAHGRGAGRPAAAPARAPAHAARGRRRVDPALPRARPGRPLRVRPGGAQGVGVDLKIG